jgi:hypothetical protein
MPSNTANGHSLSSTIRLLSGIFLAPCSLTLYTHRYSMLSHLKIHAKPTECGEDERPATRDLSILLDTPVIGNVQMCFHRALMLLGCFRGDAVEH